MKFFEKMHILIYKLNEYIVLIYQFTYILNLKLQ
jgi:hypothetical protein